MSLRAVSGKGVNKIAGGQKEIPVTSSAVRQQEAFSFLEASDVGLQRLSGNNREPEGQEGKSSSTPEIRADRAETRNHDSDSEKPMWIIPCFRNSERDDQAVQIRVGRLTFDGALFSRFRREYFTICS